MSATTGAPSVPARLMSMDSSLVRKGASETIVASPKVPSPILVDSKDNEDPTVKNRIMELAKQGRQISFLNGTAGVKGDKNALKEAAKSMTIDQLKIELTRRGIDIKSITKEGTLLKRLIKAIDDGESFVDARQNKIKAANDALESNPELVAPLQIAELGEKEVGYAAVEAARCKKGNCKLGYLAGSSEDPKEKGGMPRNEFTTDEKVKTSVEDSSNHSEQQSTNKLESTFSLLKGWNFGFDKFLKKRSSTDSGPEPVAVQGVIAASPGLKEDSRDTFLGDAGVPSTQVSAILPGAEPSAPTLPPHSAASNVESNDKDNKGKKNMKDGKTIHISGTDAEFLGIPSHHKVLEEKFHAPESTTVKPPTENMLSPGMSPAGSPPNVGEPIVLDWPTGEETSNQIVPQVGVPSAPDMMTGPVIPGMQISNVPMMGIVAESGPITVPGVIPAPPIVT